MKLFRTKPMGVMILMLLSFLLLSPNNLYALELVSPGDYTKDNLSVGSEYYLDRDYTITSQPPGFQDYTAILTRNQDKWVTDDVHIVFNISNDATVYVAYDMRWGSLPTWMQSFSSTGNSVGTTDVTLDLYKKDFSAGQVVLGGNRNGVSTENNYSNYFVYVDEHIPLAVDPTSLDIPVGGTATSTVSGGVASYNVSSSNPSVATATLSVDEVTVTGVAEGSVTITVTDSDSPANSAVINVDVTIVPIAVNPDTLSINVGGVGNSTISGGASPYSVSSSNSSVATATVDGNTITVTGVSEDSATITVTDSASNSTPLSVTVTAPLTVDYTVLNIYVGQSVNVTISDGSSPYSAVSNNTSIATADLNDDVVTVTGVAVGSTTVTITDSASAMATVTVNVGTAPSSTLEACPTPPFVTGANMPANILLILDHSGSMGSGSGSRWDTAKTVIKNIIDDFPDVRFGLMRMDGSNYSGDDHWYSSAKVVRQGGKILKPVGTSGDEIKTYITNWGDSSNNPQTWTNLAETLASAGQYFATVVEEGNRVGKGPQGFGHYEKNYHYDFGGSTYDATLTDDKGNTINTTSPIGFYCEKSFVIFVTDGLANYDNDWDVVTDVIGNYDGDGESGDCEYGEAGCSGEGTYFDDVAEYLYEHDMRSDLDGTQNITTYVIGFQIDDTLLSSAASQGGGQYFTASTADQLTSALQSTVKDILDKVSAGTSISTISTSAESDDHLVRAKFLPVSWKGYLEAFTLPFADGDTPIWQAGDILSNTNHGNRHIYTYRGSEITKKQEFISSNSALKTYLSNEWSVTETEAADLMDYIRGDPTYEGGKYRDRDDWPLGDIIHSTPVIIGPPKMYFLENDYPTFRQDNSTRTEMVYVGANDGMLHAFRAKDDPNADCSVGGADAGSQLCGGSEQWAFIPEGLQVDLKGLTGDCHKYYVDLPPLATDIYDSAGGAWKTVLIGGNRLGGEEYFVLDVTDPSHNNFSALWDTIPFSGFKSSTHPVVGKVKVKEGEAGEIDKWATIITSGYHEGTTTGRIAALNFTDGSKEAIWNDGTSDVNQLVTQTKQGANTYYTLSSPVALDSDDDGYLDLIYTGDTEGTLWKFYYDYVGKIWKKVALFNTGGQPITVKPSLVFDKEGRLRIFFGTGKYIIGYDKYNTTRNAFYSLVEDPVETEDANDGHFTGTTAISKTNDLVNVTPYVRDADFDSLEDSVKEQVMDEGWYFELDNPGVNPGERIVSEAAVIAGVVFFTSFTPNSDVCGFGGDSRMYAVDFEVGVAATSVFDEADPTKRYLYLGAGLASEPVYYFSAATKQGTIIVQTSDAQIHEEDVDVESRAMAITSWRAN